MADDRRTCSQCRNLAHNGFCVAARRGEVHRPTRTWYEPIPDLLHRCGAYAPNAEDEDRRPGFERWPFLTEDKSDET